MVRRAEAAKEKLVAQLSVVLDAHFSTNPGPNRKSPKTNFNFSPENKRNKQEKWSRQMSG
jgi:hypothetical protein